MSAVSSSSDPPADNGNYRGRLYREEIKFSGRWSSRQYAIEDGWLRDLDDASEPKIMLKLAAVSAPKTARGMLAFRIVAHNTRRVFAASPETLHSWLQALGNAGASIDFMLPRFERLEVVWKGELDVKQHMLGWKRQHIELSIAHSVANPYPTRTCRLCAFDAVASEEAAWQLLVARSAQGLPESSAGLVAMKQPDGTLIEMTTAESDDGKKQVTTRLRAGSADAAKAWSETLVRAHAATIKGPWEEEGAAAKEAAAKEEEAAKAAAKQRAEAEVQEAREQLQAEAASVAQERVAVAKARQALQREVEGLAAARTAQEAELAREEELLAAARAAYETAREQTAQEAARQAEEEARCAAARKEATAAAAASAEVQAQLSTARDELAKAERALKAAKEAEYTCRTKQRKAEERAESAESAAEKLEAKRRGDAEALAPLRRAVAAATLERSALEAELEDQLRGARRAQEAAAATAAAGSGALVTEMVGKVAGWAAAAKAAVAKARAPDASAQEASAVAAPATASPAPAASAPPAAAAAPPAASAPPAAAEPMSADAASAAALAEALAAARAGPSLENGMMGMMGRAISSLRTMGAALAAHMEDPQHGAELAARPKRKRRLERLAEATRAALGMFDGGAGDRVSVAKLEAAVEKVLRFAPPPPDVLEAMRAELGEGESIAFPVSDEPGGESDEESVGSDSSDDDDDGSDDDDDDDGSESAPSDDEEESDGAEGGDGKDYQGLLEELAAGEAAAEEGGNFLRVSEEDEDEGDGGAEGAGEASTDGVKAEADEDADAGAGAEKPPKLTLDFYGKVPASKTGEVAAALAACAARGRLQRVSLSFESGGKPGDAGLAALISAVGVEGSKVEVLGLDEPKRVGSEFLAALASLIGAHSRLRALSLGGMRPQAADWLGCAPAFGAALSASALTELYLPDCRLTPEAVALLALRLGSALQRLDLSRNNVGDRGAAGLAAALAANASGLRSLSLDSARVKGDGAVALARAAGSLRDLSLPFNPGFDSSAAAALAEALADGACRLESLDLAETKVKDVGVAAIGRALAANRQTRLKHLNVQDTLVAASGVQALADALLAAHAALVTLELRSNQLSDREMAPLVAAVAGGNSSLRELSLIWNDLGDATARAFAAALPQLASLTELGLASNLLTDEGLRALCEALPQNRTIRRLTGGTHLGNQTSKGAEKELEKLARAWETPGRQDTADRPDLDD